MPLLDPSTPLGRLRAHCQAEPGRAWIEGNPPYGPRYWEDSWNSWAISIRSLAWMHACRTGQVSDRELVLRSLTQQLEFLLSNLELDIRGNHLLKNARTLLFAGRFFAGRLGQRCHRVGRQLLEECLAEQFPDGLHFENSPAYHCEATADLIDCQACLDEPHPRLEALIALARRAVAELTHPDGQLSLLNDGGFSWLRPVASEARDHFHYPQAGYAGLRGPDFLLLYDFGQLAPDALPAHSHADIFSFELSVQGQRVFVDHGCFQYHPGRWRRYARSTPIHNTVSLDGGDQGDLSGAFRLGRRGRTRVLRCRVEPDLLEVLAEHTGFAHLPGAPVHRRHLRATRTGLEVHDSLLGGRSQRARASLLLHPAIRPRPVEGGLELGPTNLFTSCSFCFRRSWWCPDLGVRVPTVKILFEYGLVPCQGFFRVTWNDAGCTSGS